jgi:predicted phage gp36 major capsid-like protein
LIPETLSPLPAARESEVGFQQNEFTTSEASDELTAHLEFVRSRFNLIQLKNEREWMEAVFRCEREKVDFQKLFEFIESKRDPTKSGSVTPKMMLSDNWIASFKNPTPKKENENGKSGRSAQTGGYKTAAEKHNEQIIRNLASIAELRRGSNSGNGSGNQKQISGNGEGIDCEVIGAGEPDNPF